MTAKMRVTRLEKQMKECTTPGGNRFEAWAVRRGPEGPCYTGYVLVNDPKTGQLTQEYRPDMDGVSCR